MFMVFTVLECEFISGHNYTTISAHPCK